MQAAPSPTITAFAVAPAVSAPPTTMSVDDFLVAYAGEPRAELVKGVVRMQGMTNPLHGWVGVQFTRLLANFVADNDLGYVMGLDTRVRTGPDSVRGGDAMFFSYARMPKGTLSTAMPAVAPDLVGEVKSPSDTWIEVFTKVLEYLRSGVRAVVLDPDTRTVSVYRADVLQEILGVADTLTLPDVLPGFAVPIARLFPG